jgi:hypothetical protein
MPAQSKKHKPPCPTCGGGGVAVLTSRGGVLSRPGEISHGALEYLSALRVCLCDCVVNRLEALERGGAT